MGKERFMLDFEIIRGILLPFAGTTLGAACVFFMKKDLHEGVQRVLTGFAAGVMVAASVWSLLIPALEQSEHMGKWGFIPAAVGFLLGMGFLLLLDELIPHLHMNSEEAEGPKTSLSKTTMLLLAVTLHNIPEGMAVGVVFAGWIQGNVDISAMGALALALGIAIQNFPEGAIISMPLKAQGVSKGRSFLYGTLTGIVEPLAAFFTILAAGLVVPALPYLLSFAAGAMIYVVVEELIPEMAEGEHSNAGTIAFAVGFVVMMVLDVALGQNFCGNVPIVRSSFPRSNMKMFYWIRSREICGLSCRPAAVAVHFPFLNILIEGIVSMPYMAARDGSFRVLIRPMTISGCSWAKSRRMVSCLRDISFSGLEKYKRTGFGPEKIIREKF